MPPELKKEAPTNMNLSNVEEFSNKYDRSLNHAVLPTVHKSMECLLEQFLLFRKNTLPVGIIQYRN